MYPEPWIANAGLCSKGITLSPEICNRVRINGSSSVPSKEEPKSKTETRIGPPYILQEKAGPCCYARKNNPDDPISSAFATNCHPYAILPMHRLVLASLCLLLALLLNHRVPRIPPHQHRLNPHPSSPTSAPPPPAHPSSCYNTSSPASP